MTLPQALLIAFAGAICALLLLVAMRAAGRAFLNYCARRVEQMAAAGLARPIHPRDWDAEMMALVAAEQNRDDA